jgi:hypothetical protein
MKTKIIFSAMLLISSAIWSESIALPENHKEIVSKKWKLKKILRDSTDVTKMLKKQTFTAIEFVANGKLKTNEPGVTSASWKFENNELIMDTLHKDKRDPKNPIRATVNYSEVEATAKSLKFSKNFGGVKMTWIFSK